VEALLTLLSDDASTKEQETPDLFYDVDAGFAGISEAIRYSGSGGDSMLACNTDSLLEDSYIDAFGRVRRGNVSIPGSLNSSVHGGRESLSNSAHGGVLSTSTHAPPHAITRRLSGPCPGSAPISCTGPPGHGVLRFPHQPQQQGSNDRADRTDGARTGAGFPAEVRKNTSWSIEGTLVNKD
jgi:hypothetical protein